MQQQTLQPASRGAGTTGANPNSPDGFINTHDEGNAETALEQRLSEQLRKAQLDADRFTKNDQSIKRKDTVEVVLDILNRIKTTAEEVNKQSQELRERLYHITFNSTVLIFNLTRTLREANYSKEATHFLAFNVLCLDNNLILTTAKYLDWRVMNYVELARAYADLQAFKAAFKVANYGVQKVLYLKQIEEQDPPVPDGTKETLVESLRVLRTQELKYQLASGALTPDAWKKKLEETFTSNKYHRSLAIVECLNTNDPLNCRQIQRSAKLLTVKTQALKLALDLVKTDIELLKQALIQIHEKKKRDREKKDALANREAQPELNIDEMLERYKVLDMEMIKERDWKFASYNVPIEVHVELLKLCFECRFWPEFDTLLDPALIRLKFRRYETPYLATVDVLMSANRTANIPNGFEKIPKDLNAANLKIELKKLRQQAKLAGTSGPPEKKEDKKDDKKQPAPAQAAPAKPDPKAAAAAKGGKPDPKAAQPVAQQEIPKDEEDEGHVQASEAELERIKHVYVNLLLQRTKNSQNAIVGIDVVMADENVGPDLPDNHFAVAVPIRQHHGVYEKTKLIPYIVFRRTANGLIDEEDCLSIITDVQIVMGQDAHLRAPLGYHKIQVDLRQTPKDLERVPNLDYVFICYKTDKQLALTERDLLVFRRLAELEKSFIEKGQQASPSTDENRAFLNINYSLEMLVDLARTVKEALLGPLGDFYLEHRQDILFDLSGLLWQKYLLPILQRMDLYTEMRHQREYPVEFVQNMDELIIQVKNSFSEAFNIMHRILTRMNFVEDMIMYSKFAVYLASLQEELGEFRNAVQTLRAAIGKITEYREERLKQSLDSKENIRTTMSITVDNKRIGDIESKIQQVYEAWEQMILRKERDRERREQEVNPLEEDEGDEEQAEVMRCIEELKNKDLFEKGISWEEWRKTMRQKNQLQNVKYYNEQEQIVHSLHCDLLLCLYRCEIKLGKEMAVVKTQTNKLLQTQGIDLSKHAPGNLTKNLSTSLQQKMNQTKTNKTLAKAKQDLSTLKQTLQEAGKLPPPKPQIQSYEKLLEKENNHNPYQNALLQMCLAVAKSNIVEQKSLLLEAIEFLKKAKAQEDQMSNLAVENAIYIKAASHYHEYFHRSADQVHPFHLMAQQQYIKKTPAPQKPIFICRTSTSIMMKLPFYKPITEYKSWRNIADMALYGKPSGSGVGVSLNNTEYDGTGEKRPPGDIVRVTGLVPNEKYVFAAGGYTADGICVNGIGETSTEVIALLPLSLHQLYGYLAEIAYKLGHYQIAKQAAETLCSQFLEKNELKYAFLDTRVNPILAFKLNTSYLQLISPIKAKQLAEAFLILARVSKVVKSDTQKRAETHELKVEKQKIDMKICNYLLIALDISMSINQPVMTKRIVSDIFNHLVPYFEMNLRPQLLFQVLFKCHAAATKNIPQELIDSNMRRVIGCLTYQILRLGFEYAEDESLKRVMLSELPMNTRKWRKYIQYQVRKPELSEEQRLRFEDQQKRIALGEFIPEAEQVKEPEPVEDRLIKVEEFENEGGSLEEFLLSLIDYQDIVKAKTERWKLQINRFQKAATNGTEVVEKLKDELVQVVDFWEGIKLNNPAQQLQQILNAFDAANPNPKYLEFCCKCIRRSMELNLQSFAELEDILQNKIKTGSPQVEELVSLVENKITERIEYLEKDIVRKQRRRFNMLEEKVQQLQEEKSISGGNMVMNIEKLMESLNKPGTAEASLKEEDYFGCLPFDTEQEEKFGTYQYLWISEKLLLHGMCMFLQLAAQIPQRSQLSLVMSNSPGNSCVFNDILQLDFSKSKQSLDEYNERYQQMAKSFYDENKEAGANTSDIKYQPKIEERVVKMTAFLRTMSRAAEYAKHARAWLQLENIIRYTWNAFSYDLTTPLELKETEAWKYVVQISECSLVLMEQLKANGGKLRKSWAREIDELKNQKPSLNVQNKTVAFSLHQNEEEKTMKRQDSKETLGTARSQSTSNGGGSGKGLKWFEKIADQFEVSVHASFIAFGIQCLMGVKQWESLVDLSNRLNDVTLNHYASQLLPFIIYAQTTLYQEAAGRTHAKRNELQARIQAFENWKLTNKKKRSRQAMITGEIPPEEQEFLRDKAKLEKEIFRLEIIEHVLNSDKMHSDVLLENIKRDANACEESLKQCRKLYFQFGVETQGLRIEELRKGWQHFEIKTKRKGHKVYSSMVISNYKKCVELLRKRQEKFMLIQALHELGNLLYADGQLGEAEIQWNDCVDTIFQRLYVLNSFRQVFKDNSGAMLADAFGSRQCLIGGVVLTKLAKLCYEGRDLHRYNECMLMASELFAAPARLSLPHPQTPIEYGAYRLREFLDEQLFVDKYVITPSELLHTLSYTAQALMDAEMHEKALPLASLSEYLAYEVVKSRVLTVKARVMKALALTELGYINEAYQLYNRILSLKDLPKAAPSRESELTTKKDGKNFYFPYQQRYHNHLPPEHDKNQEAIQNILKPLPAAEVLTPLKRMCSPYVVELLQYLRCSLLVRLGESENVEMPEKQDLRQQLLKAAEEGLRGGVLKAMQVNEEVTYLRERIEQLSLKQIDIPEQELADLKARLQRAYEATAVPEEEQRLYYSNKEEEMCYADRRTQILNLLLRGRWLVARIHQKQGLLLNQFYVLRQGLVNFKAFCEGKHAKVETGLESEDKGSFRLPEMYGGSGLGLAAPVDPKAKAGAPPAKAPAPDPKKAPPGKGGAAAQQQDDEEMKRQEEERKKREAEEELRERLKIEAAERRDHPNMYLWLKIKVEIINILYHQRRFDDCQDAIAVTRLECQAINDLYFLRQLMEVEYLLDLARGELDSALKTAEKVRKHAAAYYQNDLQFAQFLGNLSETLYNRDHSYSCIEPAKEGRAIVWLKLRDLGIDIDPQNVNFKGDQVKVNKARAKPNEDVLAAFQSAPASAPGGKGAPPAKGGPPPAKGAPPAKGGQPVAADQDLPVEEEKPEIALDFSQKVEYPLVPSDPNVNSSYVEPNIYLRYLESAVRFDVRYAQYLTMLAKPSQDATPSRPQHDLAKKLLTDTEKLVKRTLHLSPQLKFYVFYLLGYANLRLFYEKVSDFQKQYAANPKYKETLAKHIPYGSIALGPFLMELPNFSDTLRKEFREYLEQAKKQLKAAVDIGRGEALVYEFDFSIVDALRALGETAFLIMEYRSRMLSYKYAKYKELDNARKLANKVQQKKEQDHIMNVSHEDNLALQEEIKHAKDEWEEQKLNKEKIEVANARRWAVFYMDACVNASRALREFQDKQHLLASAQAALADNGAKIPREVASEMFEIAQVTKVNYAKIPDFEPKDKTAITPAEILAYLKGLSKELEFLTFGEEKQRQSKLISKLHRYLKANLAQSYGVKCSLDTQILAKLEGPEEFKDIAAVNTADTNVEGFLQRSKIIGKWFDFKGQKSSFFYVIGPADEGVLNALYPPPGTESLADDDTRRREEIRKENVVLHMGSVDVDPLVLSALYQEVKDLADKMRASEKNGSAAQNERDRKGYRVKFNQLIERFGTLFKPPASLDDDENPDSLLGAETVMDLFADTPVLLPDLTVDNVEKLAQLLQKDSGCLFQDPKFNTIFRRFHRLRYVR